MVSSQNNVYLLEVFAYYGERPSCDTNVRGQKRKALFSVYIRNNFFSCQAPRTQKMLKHVNVCSF